MTLRVNFRWPKEKDKELTANDMSEKHPQSVNNCEDEGPKFELNINRRGIC